MDSAIKKVANFFNKTLLDSQISELAKYLHFENFRKNPSVNLKDFKELKIIKSGEQDFIRQGKNNENKEDLTTELNQKIDKWIQDHMKKMALKFPLNEDHKKKITYEMKI